MQRFDDWATDRAVTRVRGAAVSRGAATWPTPSSAATWCGPARAPAASRASSCRTRAASLSTTRWTRCACAGRRPTRCLCRPGAQATGLRSSRPPAAPLPARCHRTAAAPAPHANALDVGGTIGASLFGAGPAVGTGAPAAGLPAHCADHLPELRGRAGAASARRHATAAAGRSVAGRRAGVRRTAGVVAQRLRLRAAQQLWRLGVLHHRLRVRARPPAPERRLGGARAGGPPAAPGRAG